MKAHQVWELVSCCFSEDDGSLPSIEIQNLSPSELAKLYSNISQKGKLVSKNVLVRETESGAELELHTVDNAAESVARYQIEPFHAVYSGLESNRITLPDLGFFFFQELVAIDYRMGSHWNAETVLAFFAWLDQIVQSSGDGEVVPSAYDGPVNPEAFIAAWQEYSASSS